jgi:hypothetical protein
MMRPDELRKKVAELEGLERAVDKLRRAETICNGNLYYDGHTGTSFTEEEVEVIRRALCEHYEDAVTIQSNRLRNSGIDPTSIVSPHNCQEAK